MTALSHQPAESSVRKMQAINVYMLNPLFFIIFLGTAAAAFVLAVATMVRAPRSGAPLLLAGSASYLIGTVGVTMVFNEPLNNRLSVLNPDTAEAAKYWLTYLFEWVRWNHVRTVSSVMATALLILAISQLRLVAE